MLITEKLFKIVRETILKKIREFIN